MEEISRRKLLTGTCAIAVLGTFGALPASANIPTGAIKKIPNGKLSIQLGKITALAKVGGATQIGIFKGKPFAIARTGSAKYIAFTLSCPHQGVTVAQTENGWRCDAHGSEFSTNGGLVFGPATTGLFKLPIKVSKGVATVG